jgi:hypothetical protein
LEVVEELGEGEGDGVNGGDDNGDDDDGGGGGGGGRADLIAEWREPILICPMGS